MKQMLLEEKKESHIKVKPLDIKKIRPQLFINTEKDLIDISEQKSEPVTSVFKEIDKYSITPTTFKSRTLFESNMPIINKVQEELEKINTKKASIDIEISNINKSLQNLNNIKIISSGELLGYKAQLQQTFISSLETKFNELEGYNKALVQYQGFIETNLGIPMLYQDIYKNSDTFVTRYGINVANMLPEQSNELVKIYNPLIDKKGSVKSKGSNKSAKDDQDILLHPLEVFLIRDAIHDLIYKGVKTVLVDIFARKDDGAIKMESTKPEVHTIVLYVQPNEGKNQIVIIDPSNSEFSKHLVFNTFKRLFEPDTDIELLIPQKELRIYEPADKNKIGPNSDQYRDCIDIGVKIAFGLNKFKGKIDIKDITALDIIKQVTNSDDMNEYLPDLEEADPLRIKQASEDRVRESFYDLSTSIEKQITSLANYDSKARASEAYKQMNNNQLAGFINASNVTYEQTIQGLEQIYKLNASIFAHYVNPVNCEHIEVQTDISGNVTQINEELI
jgi:hypothetical protein